MALAAICPHCHTTFRVASDQLKLRGGIVRCGACQEVFDGNAALVDADALAAVPPAPAARQDVATLPPSDPAPAADSAAPASDDGIGALPVLDSVVGTESAAAVLSDTAAIDAVSNDVTPADAAAADSAPEDRAPVEQAAASYTIDFDTTLDDPAPLPAPPVPAPEPAADEHLQALPAPDDSPFEDLVTPSEGTQRAPAAVDSLAPLLTRASAAAEDRPGPSTLMQAGQAKVAKRQQAAAGRKKAAAALPPLAEPAPPAPAPAVDEPEFVRHGRLREQGGAQRRRLFGAASVVLALLLLVQGVWNFRNVTAARYPASRPLLAATCALLGCKVELPAQIDALAVETGELQSLGADTFSFTTLLRNQGDLVQAWPSIELALTDANDKTLLRRVFVPADYLGPANTAAKGFAARSEQPVKLYFQLQQIKASGYHLAIFYP